MKTVDDWLNTPNGASEQHPRRSVMTHTEIIAARLGWAAATEALGQGLTPRDSAQPLRDLTDDERDLAFHGMSGDELEEFAKTYAREALRAQAASVEPVGVYLGEGTEGSLIQLLEDIPKNTKLYAGGAPAHIPADVEAIVGEVFQKWAGSNDHGAKYYRTYEQGFRNMAADLLSRLAPQPQAVAARSSTARVGELATLLWDIGMSCSDKAKGVELAVRALTKVKELRAALQAYRQPHAQQALENVADAEIKALYIDWHGNDKGWLGIEGSYFISGVSAARKQQAVAEGAGEVAYCPNCDGSGESTHMDSGGPDARELPCVCPHCNGEQTLEAAYRGVVELLQKEHTKYIQLCGKEYFATKGQRS